MTADTLRTRRTLRRWAFALSAAGLLALAGCKTSKEATGTGVGGGRKNDPLVYGPTRIPRQDLPLPERDRGIGTKGKADPLTTPTGREKAGYTDDPERFKGTVLPGKTTTPASLAGRMNDGEELKIETPGVTLQPVGGALPADLGEGVSPLFDRLEKAGVKREDRTLGRENGKYVFRASVVISAEGARREYTGEGATAYEAVKQVVDQVAPAK